MFPLPLLLLAQRARLRRRTHADNDEDKDNLDPPRLASTAANVLLAKLPKGFHADRHLIAPLADLVESTPAAHPILDAALVHALHTVHRVVEPQRSRSTSSDHALADLDLDLDRALALLQALLDRVVQANPPEPLALLRRFLATVADLDLDLPDAMVQQLSEYFYSWFQARHHADFIPLFVAWLTSQNGRVMTLYVREYDWDDLFTLLQTRFDAAAPLLTTMATVLRREHGVRGAFLEQGGIMVAKLLLRRVHRDPRHKRDLLVILNLFKGLVPRIDALDRGQGVEDEDVDSVDDTRRLSMRPFSSRAKSTCSLRRSSTSSSPTSTSSDTPPPRRPRRPGVATLLPRESRTRKPRYPLPDPRATSGSKTLTNADTADTTDRSPSPSRRKSNGTTLLPRRTTDPPSRSSRAPTPRPPSSLDQSTTDLEPASRISPACLALLARLRSRTPWFDDLLAFVSRAGLTLDDAFEVAERVHAALRAVLDDAPDAGELVASVQVAAVEREDPDSDAADLFVMQCLRVLHALATNIDVGSMTEADAAVSPPTSTQPSLNASLNASLNTSLNTSQRAGAGARPASALLDASGSSTKSSKDKDKPTTNPDLSTAAGLATLLAGSRVPQAPLYRLPALPNDDPAAPFAAHFALKSRLMDLGFLDTLMTCLESYNVDVLLATAAGVQAFSVDPGAGKAMLCLRSESAGVGREEAGVDGNEGGGGGPVPSRAAAFASTLSLGASEFDLFGEPTSTARAAAGKGKKGEAKKGTSKSGAAKKSASKEGAAKKGSTDVKARPTSSSPSRPAGASTTSKPSTGTSAKTTKSKSARSTPAPSRPASATLRRSPKRGPTTPAAPTAPSPTFPAAAASLVPRPLAPAHEYAHVLDMLHVLRHSHHPVLQRHARAAFWSLCRVGTRRTNQVALELVQDGIWGRILAGM
ncbi:hypothetical protein AMAG_16821 [Allomyces macrogynus ATCC 38327]|uniref:Uncharacterized protein n=1 Tax=Allomyces macrogynus (strain ATCC 38327) TaxID=578462 RepID=A0A0L0TC59_ALLM3|nr:hypothetical protein AMAG_16821 [Allomyces macrogynus ATCC 38327]|eukprot:KNE72337.1 hypothetical protein AMAG_16821 [Allomyces macrogynus ATCC 38327]